MEALFRNETFQIILVGLSAPVLLLLFMALLAFFAMLFPEPGRSGSRREFSEGNDGTYRPSAWRPSVSPQLVAQPMPLQLQMNQRGRSMITARSELPYWQYESLPPVQPPLLALPPPPLPLLNDDIDDEDDELTNPFISIKQLMELDKIVLDGVPIHPTMIPDNQTGQLLKRLLDHSDGADWKRAILLREGIPVGYPNSDYLQCECVKASESEADEVFDAVFAIEEVEIRPLNEDERRKVGQCIEGGAVSSAPVLTID